MKNKKTIRKGLDRTTEKIFTSICETKRLGMTTPFFCFLGHFEMDFSTFLKTNKRFF